MQITININGIETTITLTPEQIAQITAANKPKVFEYKKGSTWFIDYSCVKDTWTDITNNVCLKYGRYRRTKEQAKMDFKRQTRMMRLSALAWEVGGCVEYEEGKITYFIVEHAGKWKILKSKDLFYPETVYMTEETAIKVCKMLNSGEYSLDVE